MSELANGYSRRSAAAAAAALSRPRRPASGCPPAEFIKARLLVEAARS